MSAPHVDVAVEETTVRYDDLGNVLNEDLEDRYPHPIYQKKGGVGATEEWYEMTALPRAHLDAREERQRRQRLQFAI